MKTHSSKNHLSFFAITSTQFRACCASGALLFLSMFFLAGTATAVPPLQVGDRVVTSGATAVYANPATAGNFVGTQSGNVSGTIAEGPVRVQDVWWWKVNSDSGPSGWVAERQLRNANGQQPGPREPESVNHTPTPTPSGFVTVTPASGSTVRSSHIVIHGTVTDNIYAPWLLSFCINGNPVTLDRDGKFSVSLNLRQGVNTFTFRSTTPNPRQQTNDITSYLDGSVVYGSDATRVAALRTFQHGKLNTSAGNLPPLNTAGLPNANDAHLFPDDQLFLCGDVRSNENVELSAIQALFVREHNQIAAAIAAANPSLNDEQIFQMTRRIVAAELQVITYNEFLPALLGANALRPYSGYDPDVNVGIANEFSTAAYRIGHTLINDDVEFLDNDANPIREALDLAEAFFNPQPLEETGPDPILKYLATDNAQEVDTKLVGGLRNFLFGPPGAGGFDLASRNIQRGRDHGLADYNTARAAYGLPRVTSFAQITSDPVLQAQLASLYGNVDSIDLWVGGLSEDHVSGTSVGPTFRKIIADQFERLRNGDRFWYQRNFSGQQLQALQNTRLSDVIRRNTTITKLQDNVFFFDPSILPTLQPRPGSLPPALIGATNTRFTAASIDGTWNNRDHPFWGVAGFDLMRFAPAAYADSISAPAGADRPSARFISNTVSDQTTDIPNSRNLSDWIYGLIDHDLDLTSTGDVAFDIPVPPGDPYFDPDNTGTEIIPLSRSVYDAATGTGTPNVQQQVYRITYSPH